MRSTISSPSKTSCSIRTWHFNAWTWKCSQFEKCSYRWFRRRRQHCVRTILDIDGGHHLLPEKKNVPKQEDIFNGSSCGTVQHICRLDPQKFPFRSGQSVLRLSVCRSQHSISISMLHATGSAARIFSQLLFGTIWTVIPGESESERKAKNEHSMSFSFLVFMFHRGVKHWFDVQCIWD